MFVMGKKVKKKRKINKRIVLPILALAIVGGVLFYFFNSVRAFTAPNGVVMYGAGTTSTTRGRTNGRNYTSGNPGTVSSAFSATQRTNSNIQYIVQKAAPTRIEKIDGQQKADGRLDIETCPNACASAGTFVAQWNNTVIAANTVARAFDIAYEQLSGRAMVVYANNSNGLLYYCIWDGSSWGPVSNCAPDTSGHTNEISLTDGTTALTGAPQWVKLASRGTQLSDYRSNDILLAVQDSNNDLYVAHWNGSSWLSSDDITATTTGGSAATAGSFDVGWETVSGTQMVTYANGTQLSYRTSTGSGWSGANNIGSALSTANTWDRMASDSKSNRMSMIISFTTSGTVRGYIWKTDGSTAGWTAWTTDISSETNAGVNQNIDTAWEKSNTGTPKALFVTAASNALVTTYRTWTQAGGFTAAATTTGNNSDDADNVRLAASPNTDDIMMLRSDIDCDLRMQDFDGNAWKTIVATFPTTSLSSNTSTSSCVSNTDHGQQPYDYAHLPYSAWSLNWRVYDDDTTAGDPNTPLAAQDTLTTVKPNNTVRLRMNIAELGGGTVSNNRKKLQYSSGAGCPDANSCTWTDVGAQGGGSIWRYADGGATDDASVTSGLLTGTTDLGRYYEDGTSATNDAPGGGSITEYDFTIQNNGATIGTTYYFRAYDYGSSRSGQASTNLNAILRQQILNTSGTEQSSCNDGANSVTCTYPQLMPFLAAPQAPTWVSVPGGTTTPLIQLVSTDSESDYIDYVVEWCTDNSWPCATTGGVFCQLNVVTAPTCTGNQANWSGQDANSNTAYIGAPLVAGSTIANLQVPAGTLEPNTTYYLRAKAIDPAGTNSYSIYSSTTSLQTAAIDVLIRGGTCIGGVGASCTSGTGSVIQNVQIGN